MSRYIVVGGGFAGLTAARDLAASGAEVTVLEARDRLGGRTMYRAFRGTEKKVEMGGTWYSETYMPQLQDEIERYGVETVEQPAPEQYRWNFGGEVRCGFPVPLEEGHLLEQAIYDFGTVMRRTPLSLPQEAREDLADLDISVAAWIEQRNLPPASRDFLSGWVSLYAGAPLDEISLLGVSYQCAAPYDQSAFALFTGLSHKFAHGTADLIDRLAQDARADVQFGAEVTAVEQNDTTVTVRLADGREFTADGAVIATPLNVLDKIDLIGDQFDESLNSIIGLHQPCRSIKVWALASNVPRGMFGVGFGDSVGVQWVSNEYSTPKGDLVVAFGFDPDVLDTTSIESVQAAIRQYAPEAVVHDIDYELWNEDPWANGAWGVLPPGWMSEAKYAPLQRLHGRVAFASSDWASEWAGWIAGAVVSGHSAAAALTGSDEPAHTR